MCNSYRILQQISERFYNEFERSGVVHWEICELYAKVCVCVRACICVCTCTCVCIKESVEWRREQGVG